VTTYSAIVAKKSERFEISAMTAGHFSLQSNIREQFPSHDSIATILQTLYCRRQEILHGHAENILYSWSFKK
jgi:hypothetical protein